MGELANEIDSDMIPEEYADFDPETSKSEPAINSDQVDWRKESRNTCVEECLSNQVEIDGDEFDGNIEKGNEDSVGDASQAK